MEVRLLKPIGYRKVGIILDVPGGTAEMWVERRQAEYVEQSTTARREEMVPMKSLDVAIGNKQSRRRTVTA